jgi:hypothetical protein
VLYPGRYLRGCNSSALLKSHSVESREFGQLGVPTTFSNSFSEQIPNVSWKGRALGARMFSARVSRTFEAMAASTTGAWCMVLQRAEALGEHLAT